MVVKAGVNMKEIKFRCWYDNHMFDVTDIDFAYKRINLTGADIITFKDGELMQYTGLKDKNGKEIYEGDIVKIDDDVAKVFKIKSIGKVKYFEGLFLVQNGDIIGLLSSLFALSNINYRLRGRVIGNIYDNPELLEE